MKPDNTQDTPQDTRTTSQKLMICSSLLKRGLDDGYYTVVSINARDISDYETILDHDIDDFISKTEV